MTVSANAATPVRSANRILSLDVLRGIALFGILLANVHQMFLPISYGNEPIPVVVNEVCIWFEWSLFYWLIDLKFLIVLALFDVFHGLYLYAADVLTHYAVAGLLLLIGLPLSGLATWLKAESFTNESFFTGLNTLLHETSALILGIAYCAIVLIWCKRDSTG